MALLFYSPDDDSAAWAEALRRELPDLDIRLWQEIGDPAEITMALVWLPPPGLLAGLPNLRAIFSLGAGVDSLLAQSDLPDVPLCRLVDPSLTRTMSEFVLAHILYYHRDFDIYDRQQRATRWRLRLSRSPASRTVGIMGMGELGRSAAALLRSQGFRVQGWSRSAKAVEGVSGFAGPDGLKPFLETSEFLVCLLPLTVETEGILSAPLFATLPDGAVLIHVGRGRQLVVADLLAALDSGHMRAAAVDVFPQEPLPADSRLWRHPAIRVTPHAAAYALPETAAATIAENIRRFERGEPLMGVVDRVRGY